MTPPVGTPKACGLTDPVLEAAEAAEVTGEEPLVDRASISVAIAEVAAEGEELLARAVGPAEGRDVHPPLGVELGEGEAAEPLLDGEVRVLALGGHERVVPVVDPEAGHDRVQLGVAAGRQVVGGRRRPVAEEVDLLRPGGEVDVRAGADLTAEVDPAAAAALVPVGIDTLEQVAGDARPDRQVEEVRLAQADLHEVDQGARLEVDPELLAAAAEGLAVDDVAPGLRGTLKRSKFFS